MRAGYDDRVIVKHKPEYNFLIWLCHSDELTEV